MLSPFISESIESKTGFPDDHKSMLQELLHRVTGNTPVYNVLEATGPDHMKSFKVQVETLLDDAFITSTGTGNSIQAAEQSAAEKMVARIRQRSV